MLQASTSEDPAKEEVKEKDKETGATLGKIGGGDGDGAQEGGRPPATSAQPIRDLSAEDLRQRPVTTQPPARDDFFSDLLGDKSPVPSSPSASSPSPKKPNLGRMASLESKGKGSASASPVSTKPPSPANLQEENGPKEAVPVDEVKSGVKKSGEEATGEKIATSPTPAPAVTPGDTNTAGGDDYPENEEAQPATAYLMPTSTFLFSRSP